MLGDFRTTYHNTLCVQVEHVLFPELGGLVLELPSVGLEERLVTAAREEALTRLRSNLTGPHKSVHLVWGLDTVKIFSLYQVCSCHV